VSTRPQGNGQPQIEIHTVEKKPGYVIICPATLDFLPEGLPAFLSQTLEKWVMDHPQYRVRACASFVQNGLTVALHVWYDM
jgi:hypothetical protein